MIKVLTKWLINLYETYFLKKEQGQLRNTNDSFNIRAEIRIDDGGIMEEKKRNKKSKEKEIYR